MDQITFKQKLYDWQMNVRDTIIPTSATIKLYGQNHKTRVIPVKQEHLIYDNIRKLGQIEDSLYNRLSVEMKMSDAQILKFVQDDYDKYLKGIRKQIIMLQRNWNKFFAQKRAKQIMSVLKYENIYHVCDLSNERLIPIEIILKIVFSIESKYGDHRRIKEKSEVYMDTRVLHAYNEILRLRSTTIVHPRH